MPQPLTRPAWIPLRSLAEDWSVNRIWLAGVVIGAEIATERGRHNETLVSRDDVPRLARIVKRFTAVTRG